MDFMREQMRQKNILASDDGLLGRILTPEDNGAFAPDTVAGDDSWIAPFMRAIPLDDEGFATSFPVPGNDDDADRIRAFFEEFGYVVLRDAISPAAVTRSVAETWDCLERSCKSARRDDPRTWDRWCSLKQLGFLGNTVVLSPQFCENRQNPHVHAVFAALFGTPALHVVVGRAGFMRPTRGVRLPADTATDGGGGDSEAEAHLVDKPEWKTAPGVDWLHWDMNPFTGAATTFGWRIRDVEANRGYARLRVQGLLAVSENGPDDGGFLCAPGSHRCLRAWAHAHVRDAGIMRRVLMPESSCQLQLPDGDPLKAQAQKVPMRAGSLVVWDSRLAHANYQNDSARPRMVQYVKMARADDPAVGPLFGAREELLPPREAFELTDLGRRLYGFERWPGVVMPQDGGGAEDASQQRRRRCLLQ